MSVQISSDELFADVNGITLCYQTFGDPTGKPLLLIMGLATQMIHWDTKFCLKLVEQGFWVIRFDNRDIGRSSILKDDKTPNLLSIAANRAFGIKLKVSYDLNTMARDAMALLDYLKVKSCHIVGASMGGMIAQCMAINYAERIASLTSIMSTTGSAALPEAKKAVIIKLMQPPPRQTQAYIQHSLKLWHLLNGNHFNFNKQRLTELLLQAKERSFNPDGIRRQTCAILASPDRTESLKRLNVPCLVIHGDHDLLVPVECGIATAKAVKGSDLLIIKGMGHTLPEMAWKDIISSIVKVTA